MSRVTRARLREQRAFLEAQPEWEVDSPLTRSKTRSGIIGGVYLKRAIISPRHTTNGSLVDDDDQEEYNMYGEKKAPQSNLSSESSTPRIMANESGASQAFKTLPLEIHQHIALFLPKDRDIISYALICKKSSFAINWSIWRKRFLQFFDEVAGLQPQELTWRYAFRRDVCQNWVAFDLKGLGLGRLDKEMQKVQVYNQKNAIEVIQGLLLDSKASMASDGNGKQIVRGLNLSYIADLLTGNGVSYLDIVDSIFNTSFDKDVNAAYSSRQVVTASKDKTLIYVVQLCLTPFSLHHDFCNRNVNHFDVSQYYAYSRPCSQPICTGFFKQDVNVRWLLHVVNFFKYHFKSEGEGLIAHDYKELEVDQLPQFWVGNIKGGTQPLARHWKGAYTYMENSSLASLRKWDGKKSIIHQDALDGNESFQDMDIFFDNVQNSHYSWPQDWESILCSDPFEDPEQLRRAKRHNVPTDQKPGIRQFWGSCRGSRRGHFFGRVHALTLQQGFHGFQRVSMMKFYTQMDHNEDHIYDAAQVWAYEGIVLPGGRIIVGRWWSARDDPNNIGTTSGPFMWWNVDRSGTTELIEEREAFDFLDTLQDQIVVSG
ncbi:hypothetical protein BUE80_DR007040 [Diplocarpon rosae]|nr:hypothetical protein BUE80_DR007040 [Diplocarpon rosae]